MLKPLASGRRSAAYGIRLSFSVRACPLASLTEEEVGPVTSIYIALLYWLSRNKSRVESTRGGVNMEGGARALPSMLVGAILITCLDFVLLFIVFI